MTESADSGGHAAAGGEHGAKPGPGGPPRNRMFVAVLSLGGVFLAFYLVAYNMGWIPPIPCGTGQCATVQSSKYAWVGPVPVSAIGLGGYLALFGLSIAGLQGPLAASRATAFLLFGGALFGVAFSAYLTYIEAAVLQAWCRYCVASAILISIVFLATLPELKRLRGTGGRSVAGDDS